MLGRAAADISWSFDGVSKVPAVIRVIQHTKAPALAVACIGLAACGGTKTADIPDDSDTGTVATSTTTEAPKKAPTVAQPTAAVTKVADAVGTNTKKKPEIIKPSGNPPTKLTVVDVVDGKGAA